MDVGYLKLFRQTKNNPVVMKDADHLAVWIWLLMEAVFRPVDVTFGGQRITLQPGQLTTGRKVIASELHISESKVQRILKTFENEHQIEQQTDHKCRLISICSWHKYQASEQLTEQQVNNYRTTGEQLVNTKEEYKNIRKKEILINKKERIPMSNSIPGTTMAEKVAAWKERYG